MYTKKLPVIHENKELCSLCGGQCCKKAPGIYFPEDFGITKKEILDKLLDLIMKKEVVIVTFFGGPVPRPTALGGLLKDAPEEGRCMWHSSTGCTNTHKPSQCKALQAQGQVNKLSCSMAKGFSEQEAVEAWQFIADDLYVLRDIHRKYW